MSEAPPPLPPAELRQQAIAAELRRQDPERYPNTEAGGHQAMEDAAAAMDAEVAQPEQPEGVAPEQWASVLAQRPAAVRPDAWHRMMLTSHRLAARESRLAQILYEQIEMTADHEGGMAPTWEEMQQQAAAPIPRGKRQREDRAWCSMHLMEFRAKARELLAIHDAHALEEITALLSSRAAEIRAAQQQGGADDAG
ncbi:hypothetical protein [Pseudoroseomonas cervicalis]|uniref:hypothetical protein n=1 Tax=Teichococcus cervicalis TaxID=204525 RepID=UPI0027856480|nr:hypothetical protein [Pseudoroseomonas cervicalis]MDQ1079722.1 hypothetical protein [Pseudoroseomonas cervicalis]